MDESSRWFVKKGDVEDGPLEFRHLQHLIDFDLLAPTDLVRAGGDIRWVPVGRSAIARRLHWPAKSPSPRTNRADTKPKNADAKGAVQGEEQPHPVHEKLSEIVHRGAVLIERCRVVLRGAAVALIAIGFHEVVQSVRSLLPPMDNPFFGLAVAFLFLGLAAFWVTYDGEEKY